MYEKIKSMPRLTAAVICIVMLFFPFVASEVNASGLECIKTNGLSILLLLIPVFIILVDLNVVKLQNNIDNKLILGCSVINIALLIYTWYHTAKANQGLEEIAGMFGQESTVKIRPGIGLIISLIADVVIIIITLKKHFDIDVVDKVKQNIPDNVNLPNVDLSKVNLPNVDISKINIPNAEMLTNKGTKVTCTQCGATLSTSKKFCDQCGTPVVLPKKMVCITCKKVYLPNTKFCSECGGQLIHSRAKCR